MGFVDKFLNEKTMYYLVLRGLAGLALLTVCFGFLRFLPFGGLQFIITLGFLIVTCHFANLLLGKLFKAPLNHESALITALILFFILAPVKDLSDIKVTILAGFLAIASKFVLAIHKKHLFNPAAIALVFIGFLGFGNAIWWVGSTVLFPFVLVMGLLIVRKIRRFSMFFAFLVAAFGILAIEKVSLIEVMTSWPTFFFGTVMLTEPQTTPPRRKLQVLYGAIVGLLFGSQFSFGPIYSSPELSLVVGNIFSYLVSSKEKLSLALSKKTELAPGIFEFSFSGGLKFQPGQFLEWTLPHKNLDARGTRRSFSIASTPGESSLRIIVKMAKENGSSFKKALLSMNPGDRIAAGNLAGDFILPKSGKFVFIAGGIGITPFLSMKAEKRDAVLFHAVAEVNQQVFQGEFKNFKFIPVVTSKQGFITDEMVKKEVPDYKERIFFLSGPNAMVETYRKLIKNMGVPSKNIKTDHFPGY